MTPASQLALLSASLAVALAGMPSIAWASPDMRDLTPLVRSPRVFEPESDASAPAPAPSPPPSGALKKSSTSSQVNQSKWTNVQLEPRTALERFDFFYGVFVNGPSFNAPWGTTYNAFAQDTGAMYFYHTADLQYHLTRNDLIGVEVSAKQEFFDGVTPSKMKPPAQPIPIEAALMEFQFNDPQFWYKRRAVIDHPAFSTDLQFNLWPGITDYSSKEMKEYFSLSMDSTWNLKFRDKHWTTYFTTRVRPYVYADLQPNDTYNREWLDLSAGYYLGYGFAKNWQVNFSGIFDCDFFASPEELTNLGQFSDNTAQLEVNYYLGGFARIGGFAQTVLTNPSLQKTIVGLDITVNFLSARY